MKTNVFERGTVGWRVGESFQGPVPSADIETQGASRSSAIPYHPSARERRSDAALSQLGNRGSTATFFLRRSLGIWLDLLVGRNRAAVGFALV